MTTKSIRLLASLRKVAGAPSVDVSMDGVETVRDLLAAIARDHAALANAILDEHGTLSESVQLLVNGRNVMWLQGPDTPVSADDELVLIPPVVGG